MKLSQLMLAGDYLSYKGDWATNTAYNVNDVVTWSTDGHLYEVIKAHTSSDTIAPSNTEYYKAMTATKYKGTTYSQIVNNKTTRTDLVNAVREALNQHKRVYWAYSYANGVQAFVEFTLNRYITFYAVTATGVFRNQATFDPEIIMLFISTETTELSSYNITTNGITKGNPSFDGDVTIYIEQ